MRVWLLLLVALSGLSGSVTAQTPAPPTRRAQPASRILVMPFENVKREGRIF